jgi:hypothetical protein
MEEFVPAILSLRNAKPDELIPKLHKMFKAITKMDDDEVVAAYQTLRTTAEMAGLSQNRMVVILQDALIAQMRHLGWVFHKDRYEAVTGKKFDR